MSKDAKDVLEEIRYNEGMSYFYPGDIQEAIVKNFVLTNVEAPEIDPNTGTATGRYPYWVSQEGEAFLQAHATPVAPVAPVESVENIDHEESGIQDHSVLGLSSGKVDPETKQQAINQSIKGKGTLNPEVKSKVTTTKRQRAGSLQLGALEPGEFRFIPGLQKKDVSNQVTNENKKYGPMLVDDYDRKIEEFKTGARQENPKPFLLLYVVAGDSSTIEGWTAPSNGVVIYRQV